MAAISEEERSRWPVTQVSPAEVRAFCKHQGVRLPTEAEWLFVARMGTRGRYGWGRRGELGQKANLADLKLAALAPGLKAFGTVDDGFASLAPIDALPRPGHAHPWGFYNLLGNAAEWCVAPGGRIVARGGSWLSEPRELRVDQLRQTRAITAGAWDCIGCRVVKDL